MQAKITRRGAIALSSSVALAPLIGCGEPASKGPTADDSFTALATKWIGDFAKTRPAGATQLGDHRFDGELDDVSTAGRAAKAAVMNETTEALAAIDRTKLSRDNQVDAAMLSEQLEAETFSLDTLQDWAWDPLIYSGLTVGSLYSLVAREFAPLPERLINAASRMEKFPALLAETRKQLDPARVPLIHAQTYSGQNGGSISIIDDLILAQASSLPPADLTRLQAAAETAKAAVKEHQAWIVGTLVPNAKGDYKLGANYDTKLRLSISSPIARADLLAKARADAIAVREEMFAIAEPLVKASPMSKLLPKLSGEAHKLATIAAALQIAAAQKPAREKLMEDAKKTLDEATAYCPRPRPYHPA